MDEFIFGKGKKSFIVRSVRSSNKNKVISKSVDSVKIIQNPLMSKSKSQVAYEKSSLPGDLY